ncbi:glycosyl transferase [Paenibacillus sp. LC231]|uniref:glycosyltransferase WbsX family protein n=1 Tax=unclassified Paenibacillus TaxID=185978 RepID=UPI0008DD1756|nr:MULTISPECIES: glycoside hydrolase family 99-like domain-containing protein [unclassified Paenibacillus]MCT1402773.1 glycoside hydrolase family 99-like domain-containing protein [Paenibacillus sp. p3-SID867]OIB04585.1 glycosyl transferase [Paenibacillus sp. LC231]
MKLIAFLLPQFHRIPENDAWWGEGFTEWTNTRKARALYPKHHQPNEPLNEYYYDLTSSAARLRQAELAKTYGIYGFCYYHYWFRGKRLLETPIKQVMSSKEPDLPFCLSWANESWTRRWDGGDQQILLKQDYGTEQDWEQHFDELLPAFQDERYIRIDNKPLFILYRPEHIPCCAEMVRYWRNLAISCGLDGLYIVQTLGGFPTSPLDIFDASLEFEPHYTFAHGSMERLWSHTLVGDQQHLMFDYDYVWDGMINRSHQRNGRKVFPGAFVKWDNTPRLGVRGLSCLGASPEKFGWYLAKQIKRSIHLYHSEFLFINAWNEWAEGAYLEPDKRYGYQYLEAVKQALKSNGIPLDAPSE